jgi:hypothetical protein
MALRRDLQCFLVKDTCYIRDYARVVHAENGSLMAHGGIFAVDKNNVTEIGKVIKMLLSTPLKIMSEEEYMNRLHSKEISLMLRITKTKSWGALAKISKDVTIEFMVNDNQVKFTPYKKTSSKGNKERIEDKAIVANIDDEEELGQTLLQAFEMSE